MKFKKAVKKIFPDILNKLILKLKILTLLFIGLFIISCSQVDKNMSFTTSDIYKRNEFVDLSEDPYKVKGVCPKFDDENHSDLTIKRLKDFLNVCVKQKKISQIKSFSQVILYNYKKSPWGYYYLSIAAEIEKNYELALWMLENAQLKAPGVGLFHYQKGRIKLKLKDPHGAMAEMHRAVQKDPLLFSAHLYLAQMYSYSLQFEKAITHYDSVLKKDHNHKEANVGLADCYFQLKNYKKALLYLDKAISLDYTRLDLRLKRAEIYYKKLNNYPTALSVYKKIKMLLAQNKVKGQLELDLNKTIEEIQNLIPKDEGQNRDVSSVEEKK